MALFKSKPPTRVVAVEEHFATKSFLEGPGSDMYPPTMTAPVQAELADIGEGRIAAMDEAGVDVQVLSLTAPGIESLASQEAVGLARETNDALAEAVSRFPDRFVGLAALPLSDPDAACEELERAFAKGGFRGVNVNGHARGRYLDDEGLWPVLELAEKRGVPIYLHPTVPPEPVLASSYSGNFPDHIAFGLATAGWGWHVETGTHALRLILSGALDRFPGLQIVLGHQGELLPYMLPKLELSFPQHLTGLERSLPDYLRERFYFSFGGWNWHSMLVSLQRVVGNDRIMFAADYPYVDMRDGCEFLRHLEVSSVDLEAIAHLNAEHAFGF